MASGHGVPFFAELVAAYLLNGGRGSEARGLAVADVDFAWGLVHFRPNASGTHLKNEKSARRVPLWPHLREMLTTYLAGPHAPPVDGLLFPSPSMQKRSRSSHQIRHVLSIRTSLRKHSSLAPQSTYYRSIS